MSAAEWMRRCPPRTLSGRMFVMSMLVIALPIAIAGYVLEREGRSALLHEKQEKLYGLARMLDTQLGPGYDALLADYRGDRADRAAAVRHLNARLAAFTDLVASTHPGVGVGYYDRARNAIITYGPSDQYGHTVGAPIPTDHPGWKVMASGLKAVETGPQVRGQIMNAMWPIHRDGAVIGYIWANELSDDIERQAAAMDRSVLMVSAAGILLGLGLTQALSRRLARDITAVTRGLATLRTDLHHTIPPPAGEIGAIAEEVNGMARALLDARSLTENILHSIADGVVAVDRQGRITAINPAAARMIRVRAADVMGRPYPSLFKPGAAFSSALLDTLETGREHIGVELDFPLPTQTLRINASSSLLRDCRGIAIGAVAVLKDLTEQHRLESQIMRADRLAALGELVAGVAHEVRNPLTSIRGFMQYLESCDDIAEWRQHAPIIVRQVDSLNRIVTELLEFGRPRPPAVRAVALNQLVEEVSRLAGSKSAAHVVLDLAPGLPAVEADGEAVKQAVLNLLINAIQAIPDTGTVRIATGVDAQGLAVITVADDGVGIAPENLKKVFDPFFSTKPNGTGLGLAMVHRIVDAHNGSVTITSTPGVGTRVSLHLPLVHDAAPVAA